MCRPIGRLSGRGDRACGQPFDSGCGANINALLVNEGTLRPAGFNIVGTTTLHDYQQTNTGQLFVELIGTLLNPFDRFAVTGIAQVDGYLNIDIDGDCRKYPVDNRLHLWSYDYVVQ
jgi:hypothetical protein